MPSRMNALLGAVDSYGGRESIEKYRLEVLDEDGNVFETIHAEPEQVEWHRAGYLANVADGTAPQSLSGFDDEQLIAELRRRLAERWTDPDASERGM
jgi:hypothetical protein